MKWGEVKDNIRLARFFRDSLLQVASGCLPLVRDSHRGDSFRELDRFCDALVAIRTEIQAVIDGRVDPDENVLKNAPHTVADATADVWTHPYTREQAVFPLPFVRAHKVWPSVGRINDAHGDRNLICSCPPLDDYEN